MSRAVGGEGSVAEPNLTPLLDVVLQLLMFFMMCVNFVNEQVNEEIRLPKSQSVKPMDKADTDVLYVNFKPFLLKDFQDRLPADVLARVQNRFRDGDQCILIPGKEPMRRSDFKVWLKEQYEDAKKIAEARPNGPKDVNTAVSLAVRGWAESSRTIHDMCSGRSILYVHVLQPSQLDAGSKKLTEREIAHGRAEASWIAGAHLGYPWLRKMGEKLKADGEHFIDCTQIFASESGDIYYDCVHFAEEGNRMLAKRIAEEMLAHWDEVK